MLKAGDKVERYEIVRVLGEGGMAKVYLARHTALDTFHAVKVLTLTGPSLAERLTAEGRAQAKLRHDNVVRVSDVLVADGMPALVMDFVDGPDLHHWIREVEPDPSLAEEVFRGIVLGVEAAHQAGHIHRDLKPANVLMSKNAAGRWVPKVGDFGLVKAVEGADAAWKTRSGVPMGTPMYMAPEQIRNAAGVDQRADLFALGCILYELLAHRPPFEGADLMDIFDRVEHGKRDPLPDKIPPRLVALVDALLRRDPAARPQDCRAVLSQLDGGAPPTLPASETMPLGGSQTANPRALASRPARSALAATPLALGALGAAALIGGLAVVVVLALAVGWWALSPSPDGPCPTSGGLVGYARAGGGMFPKRAGTVWTVREDTAVFSKILEEGVEAERICTLPAGTRYTLFAEPEKGWLPIHGEGVALPIEGEELPPAEEELPAEVPGPADAGTCRGAPGELVGWFYTKPALGALGSAPRAGMTWRVSEPKDVTAGQGSGPVVCRLPAGAGVPIEADPVKSGRGWWVPVHGKR